MDKTVIKAFQVFERLCQHDGPVSLSELTRETGLQKSNVHRLLNTLMHLGYVCQAPDASYMPTLKTWTLGNSVRERYNVASLARPALVALRNELGETSYLAALDRDSIVYLDVVEGTHRIRVNAKTGGQAPMHATASGKVLLAFSSGSVLDSLAEPYPRFGPNTPTTRAELEKIMAKVRRDGYAVNNEEWAEGVMGISVPIRDAGGECVAAIGVTGLAVRLAKAPPKRIIALLQEHARAISATLGFSG
ncbi:IclR family transcriptional regulator [Pigmentiphaga sp. CHJ604]|uniref:IclR family transcriptional regulator n=1 Tax=Pigmentiphaga sp. CHJ604 TaxID=3081984 RepID=UPI0030CA8183